MSIQRWQIFSLMLLSIIVLFGQLDHEAFFTGDAVIYSNRGKALQNMPLTQWADVPFTLNSQSAYDHPPFVPWMIGAMMKVFGVSNTVACAQAAFVSVATVLLVFLIGKLLVSQAFGLWAGFCLLISPQFTKLGRNPMLEPTLMFWIMLAVFYYLKLTKSDGKRWLYAVGTGIALAGAVLTKGPPAAMILGFIFSLQVLRWIRADIFSSISLPAKDFLKYLALIILIPVGFCVVFDIWHYIVTDRSFWLGYANFGLHKAINEGRRFSELDRLFYFKLFFEFIPWWPVVLFGIPLVVLQKKVEIIRAWTVGFLILFGTFFGYSLFKSNEAWLINIHYAGSALVVATAFFCFIKGMQQFVEKYSVKIFLGLATTIAVLATAFPRLFLSYPRPFERFMQEAAIALDRKYDNVSISVCTEIDHVSETSQVILFYLGARQQSCNEKAPLSMVDLRTVHDIGNNSKFVFAKHPYAIVETGM